MAEAVNGSRPFDIDSARARPRFRRLLYFVDSKRPVEEESAKKKVFSYETEQDQPDQVKSAAASVTALKKDANDAWTIVAADRRLRPTATASATSSPTLANLEEDRVVDENAADLKAYGLAEPRIDVTFHVDGEKEPKRMLVRRQDPDQRRRLREAAEQQQGLPVATRSTLVEQVRRSIFRDKTALKFEQDKVTSVELVSKNQTIRLEKTGQDWKLVSRFRRRPTSSASRG